MGTLLNRRRYMGGGSSLPYDAEIEYLESTGTQYIDTGIKDFNTSIKLLLDIQFTTTLGRQLCGATNSFYFGVNDNRWEIAYRNYRNTADTLRHILSKTGSHVGNDFQVFVELDGETIGSVNLTWGTSHVRFPLYLMATGDTTPGGMCYCKLYSSQIYTDDTLVKDLIPVRVGQTGYMYDRVSGTLFGNSGTGDFVLGPDKT